MAAAATMTAICTTTTRIDNQSRFTIFGLTCVLPDQCEIGPQTGSARRNSDRKTLTTRLAYLTGVPFINWRVHARPTEVELEPGRYWVWADDPATGKKSDRVLVVVRGHCRADSISRFRGAEGRFGGTGAMAGFGAGGWNRTLTGGDPTGF